MGRPAPKPERPSLAAQVLADLAENKSLTLDLPGSGRLHIEHATPLICVYRRAKGDAGTKQLVTAEAAYMIVPAEVRHARAAIKLLRAIVEGLATRLGGFLVVEIWSTSTNDAAVPAAIQNGDGQTPAPPFEILAPATRIPRATVEALSKSVGKDILPYGGTRITLSPFESTAPQASNRSCASATAGNGIVF